MSRMMAGRQVAVALERAERALDEALAETAALASVLPGARSRAELSAVTGQKVFEGASEALSLLTQARSRLVETHRRLEALQNSLGLRDLAVGPVDKPDEGGPRQGGGVAARQTARLTARLAG